MASGMNSILSVEPSFLYVFSVKMCCHHIYSNKRPGRLFSFWTFSRMDSYLTWVLNRD